jgi:hypothetical protein
MATLRRFIGSLLVSGRAKGDGAISACDRDTWFGQRTKPLKF